MPICYLWLRHAIEPVSLCARKNQPLRVQVIFELSSVRDLTRPFMVRIPCDVPRLR